MGIVGRMFTVALPPYIVYTTRFYEADFKKRKEQTIDYSLTFFTVAQNDTERHTQNWGNLHSCDLNEKQPVTSMGIVGDLMKLLLLSPNYN